jgi:hypothetical protein
LAPWAAQELLGAIQFVVAVHQGAKTTTVVLSIMAFLQTKKLHMQEILSV